MYDLNKLYITYTIYSHPNDITAQYYFGISVNFANLLFTIKVYLFVTRFFLKKQLVIKNPGK